MDVNEKIRSQITNYMKSQNVTQVDVARQLGITPQSVSQVLRGDRSNVRKPLLDILDALDLELVVQPKNLPVTETPPSEYGDQPNDPDAGVFEREPEPPEGLDTPAEPDEEERG